MKESLPEILDKVETDLPENQILLSFNSDDEAMSFHDWWWDHGAEMFLTYLEDKEEG